MALKKTRGCDDSQGDGNREPRDRCRCERHVGVVVRADGRAWDYRLEANLDDATRAKMLADMEQAMSANVAAKIERLGL